MGTRADFYVGKGKDAEWIGSIAWDGYRDGIDAQILNCQSEEAFRHAVNQFLTERDDGIFPKDGWPWPWKNSATTDCSYWFFDGKTWDAQTDFRGGYPAKGYVYAPCDEPEINDEEEGYEEFISELDALTEWPDFTDQYNGGDAGFMIISA